MTYTIVTDAGLIMWREDIFTTREEADAFLAENPLTPSGTPQFVADTATALLIAAEVKAARERHERALDIERHEITSRMLRNAAQFTRDTTATQSMVADMERDGLL